MDSPPDWSVQETTFYTSYESEDSADEGIGATLLIPLDPDHKNDGSFRVVIHGCEDETVSIPAEDLFPDLPDSLSGTLLHLPTDSASTMIQANSTACPWLDVIETIRKVRSRRIFHIYFNILKYRRIYHLLILNTPPYVFTYYFF
jgi:hypothetical protein